MPLILVRRPHGSGVAGGGSAHTRPQLSATATATAPRRHATLEEGLHCFAKPWYRNVSIGSVGRWRPRGPYARSA
eukprot:4562907-Prymnesium_polylepis.1